MKNNYLKQAMLLITIGFFSNVWAQVAQGPATNTAPAEKCHFHSLHEQKMANDPVYNQRTLDFNNSLANSGIPKVSNTTLRVPVVVHVMDDGTSLTQITDEEIRQGIQRINERFRKVPGSLGDGNGVDTELEFVLAVRDPSGNCTDGIVRYDFTGNSTYTSAGVFAESAGVTDNFLKAQSFWNSSEYYNFWLVSEIDNNNGGAGIQGYAFFASAHGLAYDGCVMLCNNFKSSTSTTGTHELGHAFNLYHTFQGDANGSVCPTNANCVTQGDRVCDTPPHIRSASDCVTAPNACDGGSSSNLFINNYMDYSSDACQSEFTAGQKVRITNAITVDRASFLESNGNLSLVPPVPPVVDFQASADFFCVGNPIQFFDISSCTPNTFLDSTYWTGITFNWTFTNGVDSYSSTLQNPLMNFPNPGTYDVTLTVTNAQGSNSLTQTAFFTIGNPATVACTPTSNNAGFFQQTVSNVSFNTINNSTSNVENIAYTDYTCEFNTFLTAGSTYPIDVTLNAGGSGPEVVEVYIDYNNNGTFEAGELVHSGTTGGTSTTVVTNSNVVIPGTAVQNTLLRMRVIGETNTINANELACTSSFFACDVEDYGVYIQANCSAPTIALGTTSDPSTCGATDGTIQVTGSGTGTVNWSGAATGTSGSVTLPYTITGLAAGSYSIVVNISAGCNSNTITQTLSDPGTPTIAVGTVADPTSCNGTNGTIQITGTGTGDVSWTGAASGSSTGVTLPFTITGLAAGSYSIDFNSSGCASNTVTQTLTDPPTPTIAIGTTTDPTLCLASDGTIQITGSGTGDVVWSGTASGSSAVASFPFTITGLAAGSYTIEFTASSGCVSNTVTSTLTDPGSQTIAVGTVTDPSVCAASDGTIEITGSGIGDISWSGTASGTSTGVTLPFTITGLAAGSYTINFSSTGCTSNTVTQSLTDPAAATIAVGTTSDPTTCLGSDGTIQITGSGTGDVSWSGAASGTSTGVTLPFTITGLAAGTYSIDFASTGCTSNTVTQILTDPPTPIIAVGTTSDPTFCSGTNGTIQITGTGTGDITITGGGSMTIPNVTLPYTVSSLAAGSYTIEFLSNGCTSNSVMQNLTDPATPVISLGTVSDPSACLGADGSIQITGSGSGDVVWSGATNGSAPVTTFPYTITGLGAGTYTITFTASSGCVSNTLTSTLTDPGVSTIALGTVSDPTTCLGMDGAIEITGSGTGDVSWSGAATGSATGVTLPFTITGLAAGTYSIDFVTSTGCTSNTLSQTLTDPTTPTAPVISASGVTTFCAGGSVDLTSSYANGNVWSPTGITQTITATSSGTFTVTHTDGNGCSATSSPITVNVNAVPSAPTITASGATTFCDGGSVDLTSSEATGNVWSTSAPVQTITATTSGSYDVTYTDGNGCSATSSSVTVTVNTLPATPTVTASGATTFCAGQSVDLTSSEPTGNLWSNSDVTQTITASNSGSYDVTITDANGCSATSAPIDVIVNALPSTPVITPSGSTTLCVGQTVDLTSSEATGNSWSTTDLTQTITVSASGTYDVTYTDGNGCSATSSPITVSGGNQPTVSGGASTTVCEGEMVTLVASGAQSYVWDNGITDNVAFTPPAGTTTYTVIGTDANGCTDTATVDVTASPIPTVSLTTDLTTCVYFAPSVLVGAPAGGIYLGANVNGNLFDPASAGVGTHTVYYEYESTDGCTGDASTTIIVEDCASLDDLEGTEARVYPNPMQDLLNIELEGNFEVQLFDSRGRIVSHDTGSNLLTLPTVDFEAGIYILQITSEHSNSTIRVVKN